VILSSDEGRVPWKRDGRGGLCSSVPDLLAGMADGGNDEVVAVAISITLLSLRSSRLSVLSSRSVWLHIATTIAKLQDGLVMIGQLFAVQAT
jgi:hypothetical protein